MRKKTVLLSVTRVITGVLLFVILTGIFGGLSNYFFDRFENLRTKHEDKSIVIVSIDDESLSTIGRWPWDRSDFAKFNTNLQALHPDAVGYDVLFFEKGSGDEELQKSLAESKNTILGSSLTLDSLQKPIFDNETGYTQVGDGSSGPIRSSIMYYESTDGTCVPSLSLQLYLKHAGTKILTCNSDEVTLENGETFPRKMRFSFSGSIDEVRFSDIWKDTDGKKNYDFSGKTVLIGVSIPNIQGEVSDNVSTIISPQLPGVYVHAALLDSLITKDYYHYPNYYALLAIVLIVMLVLVFVSRRGVSSRHIYIYILMILAVWILSYFAYTKNYLVPFADITAVIVIDGLINLLIWYLIGLGERRLLRSSFGRFVNPKIVDRIIEGRHTLELGGTLSQLAILFFDIRGFTTMSEKMAPNEVVSFLNQIFEITTSTVIDNDGLVDKYMGDAMMAFWNAPIPIPQYQTKAVDSAVKIVELLEEFNVKTQSGLGFGIGIHAGEATVGNIGSSKLVSYTIIGDNVNLASRIEGITKQYGLSLIVTQPVREAYEGSMEFIEIDTIIVKGKHEPIKIYSAYKTGDLEEVIIDHYDRGRELYYKGTFKEAAEQFAKIIQFGPAQALYARIQSDLLDLKPEKWHGVWKMTSK